MSELELVSESSQPLLTPENGQSLHSRPIQTLSRVVI